MSRGVEYFKILHICVALNQTFLFSSKMTKISLPLYFNNIHPRNLIYKLNFWCAPEKHISVFLGCHLYLPLYIYILLIIYII